jgi:P27 family predicted phage terminase small subunit
MLRGRKPKPTARQISEGDPSKRGKRKLEARLAAEPKPAKGLPNCPRHLKGRARYAWNFWVEELAGMNLDRRPDAMALEGACLNYSRAVEADLIVARDGMMVEESTVTEEGEKILLRIKYHPAISVSNAAWRQLRAFCGEFGFSPVSRTRLAIEKQDDGIEDLAAMLSRPRQPRPAPVVN